MWDKKWLKITNDIVSLFNLMLYVAMHTVIGFIGFKTFAALPYLLIVVLAAVAVLSIIETLYKHNRTLIIVLSILNTLFFIGIIVYFAFFTSQILVFLRVMLKVLGVYAIIFVIVYLIFYFPKIKKLRKWVAVTLCCVLIGITVVGFSDIKNFVINHFSEGAVVYAVEDDYQIVFITEVKGTGFVKIGDEIYYDEHAGSLIDNQTVHKVTVPQSILDDAKEYTIGSTSILIEEAYSAIKGRTITKTYTFRPIDESDGIQYYTVADAHDIFPGVVSAAGYYGEKTDFIVVNGDSTNFLETTASLERLVHLNYSLSKGQIPVIFARGNHELKGKKASELYRYVGTNDDDEFYFTFTLGQSVWGLVLDMGESYDDDWYEFYGTANFAPYREKQIGFVENIINNADSTYNAAGIKHRIGISHIATAFTSYSKMLFYDYFVELNTRLNQIGFDIMLNGHLHQAFYLPKGYLAGEPLNCINTQYVDEADKKPDYVATGANYNSVLCSRHSEVQALTVKDSISSGKYLGLAVFFDVKNDITELRFTNNDKDVIKSVDPFSENGQYGKVIYPN